MSVCDIFEEIRNGLWNDVFLFYLCDFCFEYLLGLDKI